MLSLFTLRTDITWVPFFSLAFSSRPRKMSGRWRAVQDHRAVLRRLIKGSPTPWSSTHIASLDGRFIHSCLCLGLCAQTSRMETIQLPFVLYSLRADMSVTLLIKFHTSLLCALQGVSTAQQTGGRAMLQSQQWHSRTRRQGHWGREEAEAAGCGGGGVNPALGGGSPPAVPI